MDVSTQCPGRQRAGPPGLAAKTVETHRPGPLEPLHPLAQIRLRSLDREMKVIPHDDEGVQPPAELFGRFKKRPLGRLGRVLLAEQIPPVVAPVDHMVTSPLPFEPQFARHGRHASATSTVCQESRHDPFGSSQDFHDHEDANHGRTRGDQAPLRRNSDCQKAAPRHVSRHEALNPQPA